MNVSMSACEVKFVYLTSTNPLLFRSRQIQNMRQPVEANPRIKAPSLPFHHRVVYRLVAVSRERQLHTRPDAVNHRTLENELEIEVENVVADNAIPIGTEATHQLPEPGEDVTLVVFESLMLLVPAQDARFDPTACVFIYKSDTKDLSEVPVQSCIKTVLGILFSLRG